MKEVIISQDYRNYLQKQGISLSDWDRATLIFNHKRFGFQEKLEALKELGEATSDDILKKQIDQRVAQDNRMLQLFKENTGNAYYILEIICEGEHEEIGIYQSFDAASDAGKEEKTDFIIVKECFSCKKKSGADQGVFGYIEFNSKGIIGNQYQLYGYPGDTDLYDKSRFENRYVDLPLLFRQGDMVKIAGTEIYGIVSGIQNGFQIRVDLFSEERKSANKTYLPHQHIPPTELEYARLDETEIRNIFLEPYLPTYLPEKECWIVKTSHGVEEGDLLYIAAEFCYDNPTYHYRYNKDSEDFDHEHSFNAVIDSLLYDPEHFSIEGAEEDYSLQERRVLMSIREAVKQVKQLKRPLTMEEGQSINKRIRELLV